MRLAMHHESEKLEIKVYSYLLLLSGYHVSTLPFSIMERDSDMHLSDPEAVYMLVNCTLCASLCTGVRYSQPGQYSLAHLAHKHTVVGRWDMRRRTGGSHHLRSGTK